MGISPERFIRLILKNQMAIMAALIKHDEKSVSYLKMMIAATAQELRKLENANE